MLDRSSNEPTTAGRPSVCRNCGALVGASEESCSACGAPKSAAQTAEVAARRQVYDRETMRFARAILTRPAPFTIIFLVACIFAYLLVVMSAGSFGDSPAFYASLVAYGGKLNELINAGEWWRLVTPIFLHGSGLHLLMNMYGLWVLGPYVERLYGSAKFVFFWVVTGVAGVLASYLTVRPGAELNAASRFLFKNADMVSVGASGALFGLIGVLFVFGIKFRHELPEGFKRAFGTGMLPTILLNVVIGFAIPAIDNAAHMGGLVAGAALALVVGYKRPHERQRVAVFWHILQAAALLLVAASFALVALNFRGRPPDWKNLSARTLLRSGQSDVPNYLTALNNAQAVIINVLNRGEAQNAENALKALDDAPSLSEGADRLRAELRALLIRAQSLAKLSIDQRQRANAAKQRVELSKDFTAWIERRDQWVKTEGKEFGVKLETGDSAPDQPNERGNQPAPQQK